jgi:hypothetical protein
MSRIKNLIAYDYCGQTDDSNSDIDPMEMPVGDLFDDDTYWCTSDEEDAI